MRRNVFSNVARRELMKQTAVRNKRTTKYMIMYFVSGFQFWNCVFWSLIVLILLSFPMFHNFLRLPVIVDTQVLGVKKLELA